MARSTAHVIRPRILTAFLDKAAKKASSDKLLSLSTCDWNRQNAEVCRGGAIGLMGKALKNMEILLEYL
ncbi:hypothetical protein TWF788_006396 [Orbilia oligospora]|uniref:Uncharacterized protein n=1 Tax=Orbilia oligospora TaxID=2813651 RepID=A0A7C8PWD4_ORBOL|nr:hypothetical protein TWF788_006396 [Orbilia oligospora]